ncbi:MAG: HAD family hydrolase [Limnochordales bacterium]|nr:HAD family hydrolase [Limnochordales bacterium]
MTKERTRPYLLFDAGGTLVFPDFRLFAELIARASPERVQVEPASLHNAFLQATHKLDVLLGRKLRGERVESQGTDLFIYRQMLAYAGVPGEKVGWILARIDEHDRQRNLWSFTYPWVAETLQALQEQGWSMSVISNSDGRVEQVLWEAGLGRFFEIVIDSHREGCEKPDPRLFQRALARLGLQPQDCLYIGDFYHIDVLGANRAGIAAVHLDRAGLAEAAGWEGVRLPSVASLPDLLSRPDFCLADPALHPFAGRRSGTDYCRRPPS